MSAEELELEFNAIEEEPSNALNSAVNFFLVHQVCGATVKLHSYYLMSDFLCS